MKFGILSFDIGNRNTITTLIEHAVKVEEEGLTRFWLGEHYGSLMWANPEPLLPVLLGMTERINIGAAGILMSLHSSYRVASSFKLMNSIFPGRVDLGIAKGGSVPNIIERMHDFESGVPHTTNKKIDDLFSFYNNEKEHLDEGLVIHPHNYPAPNLWMLGLSYNGLQDSLNYNCNFSRSLFHSVSDKLPLLEELNIFRNKFETKYGTKPKVNIAIAGVVGHTEVDANNQYKRSVWGNNGFIVPNILGSKDQFTNYVHQLNEDFDMDEIIFLDLSPTMENKYETLELLSKIQDSVPLETIRA